MSIAFFDLDRTLLAVNSGWLWIRAELRSGHITPRQAVTASGWMLRYHLGGADLEAAVRRAIASVADTPEARLRDRTWRFYEREVRARYRPGARTALARHRAAGDRLVLLTSASTYIAERVVGDLELDDMLCTRFEVRADGTFTGAPLEPLCFGPGKVRAALAYVGHAGVDLADCAFYSDSMSDRPMLEAVGRPVAVHPDPRLRRLARSRGWPVADWSMA
jgi:HAD superfamily hydrolase (TIGR01490 family)